MANTNSGDCEMAKEQGEMLLLLMQHCREMKRQESRSRWATGVVLLTFLAALIWLGFSIHASKDAHIQEQVADIGVQPLASRQPGASVHLQISGRQHGAILVKQNDSYIIQWKPDSSNKNYLTDNNTSLIIPQNSQYFVNLRVYYRIPDGHCKRKQLLLLSISIMLYHSNYPQWRNVIESKETMHCENNWYQSVDLHRVVDLEAKTEIKVKTDSENYNLISIQTYFGVTRL
ncbi:hypothetical protein P4O66_016380 [Electrophorus voltai]|uniref:THD domain-containing protein n=1 Tax=Electrophorus voltai TaxID=2609070 RepID=A0AAD8YXP9_9TELE|nr:hypothetical protein P4O66_016380 [Electrophorus voltai]